MDTPTHRRFAGVTLSLLVGLFAVPPTPAVAHEPAGHIQLSPSHFNGDAGAGHGPDVPGETNESQVVSDTFDGVDSLYSLRSAASLETRYYEWYHCPPNANPFREECSFIARDTTPTLSQPPSATVAQVAAFEANWDVPSTASGFIHGVACIEGPPARAAHCRRDAINVHLDDASTANHAPTDNGQITQPTHGGAVQNAGFTAIAFTSESDIGRILFCLDLGTSPTTPEDALPGQGCSPGTLSDDTPDDAPCGPVPAGADCWAVTIDPPDDAEFSLGIVEQDEPITPPGTSVSSGSGDCEGDTFQPVGGDGANDGDDCQLDKIYLTSKAQPADPGQPGGGGTTPQARCPGFQNDPRNQFVGTPGNDVLIGTSGPDIICGLGGRDTIRGLGGKDILIGGSGADVLLGARGSDRLTGGRGQDTLRGGRGNDRLTGSRGHDTLRGGRGNDVLRGNQGRDVLRGGPGRDRLLGGRGRDLCSGGPGADVVRGCER
jgi:hypothetical protein